MRQKKGIVTSAKMEGTVTVAVHSHAFHPVYKKRFRKSKKFLADAVGIEDLQEGDMVIITECRPLSKRKHFRVTEVVERAPRVSALQEEEGIEQVIHREKHAPEVSKKSERSPKKPQA
ncbi:30S ribosomal protein S17 [Candidatus Peregrinibacteria bacterium CG10_big_fil_rev_8_21_14_0_10_55_24]|nr:MAG: 30S ribosomal protein S17 [Candidatus Peregrinibacteria bacterium CG10_big_fil_rev_8_21_14_0_10_55_24]